MRGPPGPSLETLNGQTLNGWSRHTVTAGASEPGRPSYPDRVPTALTLLDGVTWRGQPVPGDRVAALLAALAALTGQGLDVTMVDAEQASRLGLAKAAITIWGTKVTT